MAIAQLYGNTATISTTEYSLVSNSTTLSNDTTDGVFQVFIDVTNLAPGDRYVIKIKEMTLSGGTQRTVYESVLEGEQGATLWVSPSLIFMHGWDVTMQREAGTDRSIIWSIRQVA